MSPVKRASSVDGLRRGVTHPAQTNTAAEASPPVQLQPRSDRPVRVTLNFPPDLYRQLARWCDSAAEATGLPRVSQQEALRAMVWVLTSGEARNAESHVLAEFRDGRWRR